MKDSYTPKHVVEDRGYDSPCWMWSGAKTKLGYSTTTRGGQQLYGHRVAYVDAYGPIPQGLEIDHLCRQRACVRPDHLEAVTRSVNVTRGYLARADINRLDTSAHAESDRAIERMRVVREELERIRD